jgi:RNA polymerase sigma-70 factor, ECF subfamily
MQERSLGAFGTMTVERAAVLLPETGAPPACRRVSPLRSERPEPTGPAPAPRVSSTAGAEANDYVASAAAGDVSAFEQLYRTHLPRVHSLVRRMSGGRDADELTQDVFVRVWQKLSSFRGDSAFSTWLHRLAVNVVIERFRQDATRRQRLHDGEEIFETLSAPVRSRDFSMDFEAALLSLPDGAREIFVLHDVEGYKHHEIGTLLEISSGTSKAQLHRARMMLRKYLRSER